MHDDEAHPPRRVALVSGGAAIVGHGARYLTRIATELRALGVPEVCAVVSRDAPVAEALAAAGVDVLALPFDYAGLRADRFRRLGRLAPLGRGLRRFALNDGFTRAAVRALRERGPEVVHFLDYEYLSLAPHLWRLGRGAGPRVYVTIHPADLRRPGGAPTLASTYKAVVREVWRRVLPRVDGILCHGEWIRDEVRRQLGLSGARPRWVAQPYPAEGDDLRVDPTQARRDLGLPADAAVVLWFGIIRKNKRLDLAVETLAALPGRYHLVIAGHPAELDPDAIATMIDRSGVTDRVHPVLRYLDEDEIPTFFSAADVLLATHDATFLSASGPVADARSYRLPVVVTDTGQLGHYVRAFGVGRASPPQPEAYAAALVSLLEGDTRALTHRITQAAHALDWRAFANAHLALYA
jgi:glycosyltransferase involved in cell wall biosynthesis